MSISTTQYVDEPIVQVTIEGFINEAQLSEMHQELVGICNELGSCYTLLDLLGADSTITEALTVFVANQNNFRDAFDKFRIVIVAKPKPGESTDGIQFPIFPDKDSALDYIRQRIASVS
jgi:hypothetical protein